MTAAERASSRLWTAAEACGEHDGTRICVDCAEAAILAAEAAARAGAEQRATAAEARVGHLAALAEAATHEQARLLGVAKAAEARVAELEKRVREARGLLNPDDLRDSYTALACDALDLALASDAALRAPAEVPVREAGNVPAVPDSSPRLDKYAAKARARAAAAEAARHISAKQRKMIDWALDITDRTPLPMILHCPSCFHQHIDAPKGEWTNPPHRSHLCLNPACGEIWRPADVPTVGVASIATSGKDDTIIFNFKES